jgi:hypothetical protein
MNLKIEWFPNYQARKNSQKNSQIMFQICVINQKVQEKEPTLHSWNLF